MLVLTRKENSSINICPESLVSVVTVYWDLPPLPLLCRAAGQATLPQTDQTCLDLPSHLALHLPSCHLLGSDSWGEHACLSLIWAQEGELLTVRSAIISKHPEGLFWKNSSLLFVVHSQVCKILSPLAIDIVFETLVGRKENIVQWVS